MNLITLTLMAGLASAAGPDAATSSHKIVARVDPRVELMCIIFRLAGNPEYNQPNSKSPYADEVEAHFGKYRDHAVIKLARELRASRGVSYDAVMSMAVHIRDTTQFKERVPFDKAPPRLDQRWRPDEAREFLKQARGFAKDTQFNDFFKAHRKLYEAAGQRMTSKLGERAYLDWFDSYFGARPGAKFSAIVGMLNGGCNYGVGARSLDGREDICPVLGVWQFDDDGIPVINDEIVSTVVHELCHSYTNAIVDRHADELRPAGERIFPHCADIMKRQAYGDWKTMMYESLVRVCVVRYLHATDGPAAARKAIKQEHDRGFTWIGDLSMLLEEYEAGRERYQTFDAFMPHVVNMFNTFAADYDKRIEQAPKVVSMIPPNGATDVDPSLTRIVVTFDQPMQDGMWAVVGGGPHFPELAGDVSYDKDCKVFTIPVRLKPDWSYEFWLNRGRFDTFRSKAGVRLESVAVTFKTRAR